MKFIQKLDNNAFFYKDMTQWINNKTFLLLFIGLLLVAEVSAIVIVSIPSSVGPIGAIFFNILLAFLFLYTVIIAIQGYTATNREYTDKTFELYEISGMSLERMVLGKLFSLFGQFLFGFFCIIPFLFFSYLLGGINFLYIPFISIGSLIISLPIFLFVLLLSFSSKKVKVTGVQKSGITVVGVLFLIYFIIMLIGFVVSMGVDLFDFLNDLFRLTFWHIVRLFLVTALYAEICLLLFYFSCQLLSALSDSRESALKGLVTLISITWMLFFLIMTVLNPSRYTADAVIYWVCFIPIYFVVLITGLILLYHRVDIPRVVARRIEKTGKLRRKLYYIFEPGARGTLRTLYIIIGFALFCIAIFLRVSGKTDVIQPAGILLSAPFYLGLPSLLLMIPFLRNKYKQIRGVALAWWILGAVAIIILGSIISSYYYRDDFYLKIISVVISPFTSTWTTARDDFQNQVLIYMRVFMGIIGFLLIRRVTLWRYKRSEASLGAVKSPFLKEKKSSEERA